jgi:asparagine synthase (glutamine-hydrolysing)
MYRRPLEIKINSRYSKIPLRRLAKSLNLDGALSRKKIGFSASSNLSISKEAEYQLFQKVNLEVLQWL